MLVGKKAGSGKAGTPEGKVAGRLGEVMNADDERWKKLEVWQLADAFALDVYRATQGFPREEVYGTTSQLRRAALSVPMNIVEGYSRRGDKELARFFNIALGSLAETKYLLTFSRNLGCLNDADSEGLSNTAQDLGRKLWKFYEKVREG